MTLRKIFLLACLIFTLFVVPSCDEDDEVYSPKPRGYFRIKMPEKKYRTYNGNCPFSFEIPEYSIINPDKHNLAEPCWLNLDFPQFKATIHLSYKKIEKNLEAYLEDSRGFAIKHQIKSTGIDETVIIRDSAKVYGLLYDIAGNTASSVQFYITDSTRHFLRGALYFNAAPNADSLKIVIDYIREDILKLLKTTQWRD